jgi:hypothetical protein
VNPKNHFSGQFFCDTRLANTETWHLIPPADFNMRLPDITRKSVVYLGIDNPDVSFRKISYRGTGFLMALPADKVSGAWFRYLVTAKHVAIQFKGKDFYIRANTIDGKSMDIKASKDVEWYFHPTDSAADVAVCIFEPPPRTIDALGIPTAAILKEEVRKSKGFGVTDQVFITGLFVYHQGNKKNIPIIRLGSIAMVPDERIQTSEGDMEAYLIEARSIGGLSGSPVFLIEDFPSGDMRIHLLGLIHGHWNVAPEIITDNLVEDAGIKAGVNVGIAIVTPAEKILDVLNCEGLVSWREEAQAHRLSQNLPAPDNT